MSPETEMSRTSVLELERVDKRFGKITVSDDLSLVIGRDEMVGVVGPNGAGKTSVFGIISGDLRPDSGRVLFDGEEVTTLDAAARCRLGIGRTYQVPRPFEQMTVFENVLLAAQAGAGLRRKDASDKALEVLEETGLFRHSNRAAGELGLLERKRLEVARALATNPRLLLLDEVAAGLTDPEVAEVIAIVEAARNNARARSTLAVVWVEHVVRALAATVDRLVCLDRGSMIADGLPDEVLSDHRVRSVYLGTDDEDEPAGEVALELEVQRGR